MKVNARKTPFTLRELWDCLGDMPDSAKELFAAQAMHESANFTRVWNYNFAGVKGQSPEGFYQLLRTKELVEGEYVDIRDKFRAYPNLWASVNDYLATLAKRFPQSFHAALNGATPAAYAKSLKQERYYTDTVQRYAAALEKHVKQVRKERVTWSTT